MFGFAWFGAHTPLKVVVFATWIFSPMQNAFAKEIFIRQFLRVFFMWNISLQKKNVHQRWHLLRNAGPCCCGLFFFVKLEVKVATVLCRGILLFLLFNPLFYVWTMHRCFKKFLLSFKAVQRFGVIFFKRVTLDDVRKKHFLLYTTWWGLLCNLQCCCHGVLHLPTDSRSWPCISCPRVAHSSSFATTSTNPASTSVVSLNFLPAWTVNISPLSDLFLNVKKQLFNPTFCRLIHSVRDLSVAVDNFESHGDPAADQIVRGPSGGCRGDLISTPDSGYNRVFYKSFLWGNLRFGGPFEKPSLQALFWCKKLRSRKKIGKVTKRRRLAKPTCANGGTNRANGGTNASFCTSGDFQFFLARGQVCFEFDSATVKREKKKEQRKRKTVAKGKEKRFL